MLDLRRDNLTKDDLLQAKEVRIAQIRDLLLELEQIEKFALDKSILVTREQAAEILKCDPLKIPSKIPRVRIGSKRNFQLSDIYDFIAEKKGKRP